MATIELDERELKLVREALKSFLDDFGHKEEDIVVEIRAVLDKLPAPDSAQ
jgi:hypothetical protein